jgi:hypothetical protein
MIGTRMPGKNGIKENPKNKQLRPKEGADA